MIGHNKAKVNKPLVEFRKKSEDESLEHLYRPRTSQRTKTLHISEAYIAGDGVYAYTSDLSDGIAFIKTQVEIKNEARENQISDKI